MRWRHACLHAAGAGTGLPDGRFGVPAGLGGPLSCSGRPPIGPCAAARRLVSSAAYRRRRPPPLPALVPSCLQPEPQPRGALPLALARAAPPRSSHGDVEGHRAARVRVSHQALQGAHAHMCCPAAAASRQLSGGAAELIRLPALHEPTAGRSWSKSTPWAACWVRSQWVLGVWGTPRGARCQPLQRCSHCAEALASLLAAAGKGAFGVVKLVLDKRRCAVAGRQLHVMWAVHACQAAAAEPQAPASFPLRRRRPSALLLPALADAAPFSACVPPQRRHVRLQVDLQGQAGERGGRGGREARGGCSREAGHAGHRSRRRLRGAHGRSHACGCRAVVTPCAPSLLSLLPIRTHPTLPAPGAPHRAPVRRSKLLKRSYALLRPGPRWRS